MASRIVPWFRLKIGQSDADLNAGGLDAELVVVAGHGLHLDVGDRLDALAPHHDLVATDLRKGRLNLRAMVQQLGQGPVETQRDDLGLERLRVQRRRPELGRADERDQLFPIAAEVDSPPSAAPPSRGAPARGPG